MNTLLMLIGAIVWGNLIGTFCGVVATMNPHGQEFNRRMDELNRFVDSNNLEKDLRRRLREYASTRTSQAEQRGSLHLLSHPFPSLPPSHTNRYLHQTRHLQVASSSRDLLHLLSPALQGEVTWSVNKRWLERVCFFDDAEPEFLVQISLSLTPLVFTPGELAVHGYLYIIHRGMALYGGRVLTSGRIWGEDCIIEPHLQSRW